MIRAAHRLRQFAEAWSLMVVDSNGQPSDFILKLIPTDHDQVKEPSPDLTVTDLLTVAVGIEEAQAVLDAWTIEGPHPEYHRRAQAALRESWPTLAAALDKATADRRWR